MNTNCQNCGKQIMVSINKGTAWCSEICRKALALVDQAETDTSPKEDA